ncbi:phage regulatory protein/antirepressor Ant [Mesobacillus stamsii]|uniref:Anti-repressor protein n=1 Tax=Mesobacillus stamsii TaxID=225347 RepID=A0ABU0FWS6_9BACI|nr:phage regulatory protein/antirepressor Ant [Mesobacillus stamsii]MDQ0414190.1 anti-repressor protein [Mesobacillus stamsii]
MKELVFVENNEVVTDSLTVAEVFGKEHKHVVRDIKNQTNKLFEAAEVEFLKSNFGLETYKADNNKMAKRYLLTEDAFTIVAMSYTTPEAMKFKVKFIQEFKKMRAELANKNLPSYAIEDPIERAQQWILEQTEKKKLEQQIQIDKPKVIFADAVSASKTSILIGDLAKLLKQNGYGTGQKRLFEELRQDGYLIKRKGADYNSPTQRAMEMGLFEVKETAVTHSDGHVTISKTTKVTGKGQQYFINRYLNKLVLS